MAHILDILIIVAFDVFISIGIGTALSLVDPAMAVIVVVFVYVFSFLAYFVLLEGLWNGQTLGKKAMGIRVRMADGLPLTFGAAIGRNIMRPADMFPGSYFMGLMAMFSTPKSQRIGDLIANTVVVLEKRAIPYFSPAPHTVGIHPLESQIGELLGMTIEEYNALRRFADRFPELPSHLQNQLVNDVYMPIANRRGIKPLANVHPLYLAEAAVMKYGREHGLL